MSSDHYYDWKSIDATRARRAIDKGAEVFKLPTSFCKAGGAASYRHGLKTKRGDCYVISDRAMTQAGIPVINEPS